MYGLILSKQFYICIFCIQIQTNYMYNNLNVNNVILVNDIKLRHEIEINTVSTICGDCKFFGLSGFYNIL